MTTGAVDLLDGVGQVNDCKSLHSQRSPQPGVRDRKVCVNMLYKPQGTVVT